MTRRLLIFGSTGSIGTQTLAAVDALQPDWEVVGLTAGSNVALLAEQAKRYRPQWLGVAEAAAATELRDRLGDLPVNIVTGPDAATVIAREAEADFAMAAIVGLAGLRPAVEALRHGKDIALANKEILVAAGTLVMNLARENGRQIVPVDSEHSALFQSLQGEPADSVARVILTASGGAFRDRNRAELASVTVAEALQHPNWTMGPKVTIDSATLMNKGLEVMEACHLFDLPPDRVDVLIHRESVIHSLVEFVDGSVKAQLGPPDMRLPIQYALTWPRRRPNEFDRLDLAAIGQLHFQTPDLDAFPCLRLAYTAAKTGGTLPAVLNAANEVAVECFLAGKLSFLGIAELVEAVMQRHQPVAVETLSDVESADSWARQAAWAIVGGSERCIS